MKHICPSMFVEKKRMTGVDLDLHVHITQEDYDDYPVLYHTLTTLPDGNHVSVASLDVIYCPYCGSKLLEKKD